jgi:hypothetical protein
MMKIYRVTWQEITHWWYVKHKFVHRKINGISYLLTELSPASEAAHCAATEELPNILWNPKVHYRVHNSPPLVPILSQIDPVHTITSYLSKIYFNIVHRPTSWSLSFWLSHQQTEYLARQEFMEQVSDLKYLGYLNERISKLERQWQNKM